MSVTETPQQHSPQQEPPVQLLFALGQLTGTVGALGRGVETLNGTLSSLALRVDRLEADNDRRKGQNSIITVATSAGVSLVVAIVAGTIIFLIKGA